MQEIKIERLDDSRVAMFASLTDAQLRNRADSDAGIIMAESPKVIRVALDAGFTPRAMLCESRHLTGDAADIISRLGEDVPVYTGDREVLAGLTGYTLTRGVLCALSRPSRRLKS